MYLMVDTFRFPGWLAENRAGLSFRKLAERSGVSAGHLSNLENGTYAPTDDVLRQLAAAFDVNPEWLIAQVDSTRKETVEKIERLREHAPEALGLPPATSVDRKTSTESGMVEEPVPVTIASSQDDTPKPGTIAFAQVKARRIQQEREAERLRREEELDLRIDERLAVPDVAATTDDDVHTFEPDHRDAVERDEGFIG